MALIADILLVAGALGAAFYCMVLSRRLRRFNDLESGMGGAIAVLSAQVDDMTRALEGARSSARSSSASLGDLTDRAEGVAQRLELLVASLHDLPVDENPDSAVDGPERAKRRQDAGSATEDRVSDSGPGLAFIRAHRRENSEPAEKSTPLVLRDRTEAAE